MLQDTGQATGHFGMDQTFYHFLRVFRKSFDVNMLLSFLSKKRRA
jgi:hypothetical protein